MNSLLLQAALTGATQLVLGGVVGAPPPAIPADEVSTGYVLAWDSATPCSESQAPAWDQSSPAGTDLRGRWQDVAPTSADAAGAEWQDVAPAAADAGDHWQPAAPISFGSSDLWSDVYPTAAGGPDHWQPAIFLGAAAQARWDTTAVAWLTHRAAWQPSAIMQYAHAQPMRDARPGWVSVRDAWQQAMPPLPGYWTGPIKPPVPVVPHPVALRFRCPLDHTTHLVFGRTCTPVVPPGTVIIPTRRVYIVINDASLTRVSNNLALPASSISVAIDDGRAHWSWSATLPLASLANLEPDAPGELVELEAEINGAVFRLLVESIRERESFGSAALSIGGRGLSAEIAAPAYPLVTHSNAGSAANAQQLASEALTINGVPLGWDLDWQTADWLVPAGAWAMTGSPMDAVVRIAAAAGGYVQAAPASRTLRVLPRYPIAPWDWATAVPDYILPASAVLERGVEHLNGAPCNVVFVSGRGFGARVKRTGSAADTAASMIVDPLISDTAPAAAKGLEVLGATGARRRLSIETGILPGVGVMHVGAMLDWVRGTSSIRGLVRSVSVSASMSSAKSRDPLVVRQSLEIEANA